MTEIDNILLETKHRSFDFPKGNWMYYQEWNKALFLHWKVPFEVLRELVPKQLNIDTFDGDTYVSLVAFAMEKIRPRNLPSINFISDFAEINLRTYIDNDSKKGVYFLNIEAEKSLSAFIARQLSGLPYEKSYLSRTDTTYKSINTNRSFHLDTEFEIKELQAEKTELDKWLTERYCLYLDINEAFYRYDIHHKEWEIKDVELKKLSLKYELKKLKLIRKPDLTHYSNGVKVLAWKRTKI
ncbi:MAG TPA: DUF2071 domain-containing protein [Flavobacterium sp.]|nr:DUF2071 domain-containing protein [Flavobacterium sp.]